MIIIEIEDSQVSGIKGNYGIYSAIDPIVTPVRTYMIPERCLNDPDLITANTNIQSLINDNLIPVLSLPEIGVECVQDYLYISEWGLVKCIQTHDRTEHDIPDIPALFSFFRDNSDDLEWIENEYVELGWKRWYNGWQYEVTQAHQTQSDWTPDIAITLWSKISTSSEWSAGVDYKGDNTEGSDNGDEVTYLGNNYRCLQSHTSISTWNPAAVASLWLKL